MSDVHSTGALRNCRDDGRCQYAIDHGAEGLGHCSPKCVMPRDQAGALRQQPEAVDHGRWYSIDTAPGGDSHEMFVVKAFYVLTGVGEGHRYTSDPYCVWRGVDGEFVRWPHRFQPTHWAPLPEPPQTASGSHQEARSNEQGERSLTPLEANLVATLRLLDERLRRCSEIPASAADAYDSFYQAEVAAVLEEATGEST